MKIKLGLDFGTYRSFLAVFEPNKQHPEVVVPMDRTSCLSGIPSLFYASRDGEISLCDEAENFETYDTQGLVRSIKMHFRNHENITLYGNSYSTKEIAKQIIEKVLSISFNTLHENYIEDDEIDRQMVIGVPISFGAYEKNIITEIITELGFEPELLPEPMAAALHYADSTGKKFDQVMVFDMGAGTFDTALLKTNNTQSFVDPHPYKVEGFNGNRQAGDAIDKAFAEYIINHKITDPVVRENLQNTNSTEYRHLLLGAKRIKERLSLSEQFADLISVGGRSVTVSVTRDEFNEAAIPIIKEAIDICKGVIGSNVHNNLTILMVGGSSYSPIVKQELEKAFPKFNIIRRNPEKAVALGCAVYASQPKSFQRKVAFGYAIETFAYNNVSGKDELVLCVEIPSDVPLPYQITSDYYTRHNNQSSVAFKVYEIPGAELGEKYPLTKGKALDQVELKHFFGKPVPQRTKVKLTTELTESGTLKMTADDGGISKNSSSSKEFSLGTGTYR